jgi:hypothetical protein
MGESVSERAGRWQSLKTATPYERSGGPSSTRLQSWPLKPNASETNPATRQNTLLERLEQHKADLRAFDEALQAFHARFGPLEK